MQLPLPETLLPLLPNKARNFGNSKKGRIPIWNSSFFLWNALKSYLVQFFIDPLRYLQQEGSLL